MIITFGGTPGSGKSTLARQLARKLHYPRYYLGQMMRDLATKRKLTLRQLNRLSERDPTFDRQIDEYQRQLGQTKKNLIVEGRTSFYFIPRSFKIFLAASPRVGAKRIWKDLQKRNSRNEDRQVRSLAQVEQLVRQRMRSDRKRYQQYYGINPFLKQHYNLYLDTSYLTSKQALEIVWKSIERRRHQKKISTR